MTNPAPDADMLSPEDALAALAWQIELGADEAILDVAVDRFAPPEPGSTSSNAMAVSLFPHSLRPIMA